MKMRDALWSAADAFSWQPTIPAVAFDSRTYEELPRCFAEFTLSAANGLKMTSEGLSMTDSDFFTRSEAWG
jgi:hypothetical protein